MRRRAGLTLVEVVVVLAVLGVLIALAVIGTRPTPAVAVAREMARVVRAARWTAVASGRGVILLTPDHGRTLVAVSTGTWTCTPPAGAGARQVWEAGGRGVAVAWPTRGVGFGPDGFPRSCLGDGVGSATVEIADRHARAAVVVSSLGRVRWEPRP